MNPLTRPLTEADRAALRDRMCDVAQAKFAQHGFHAVTMRDLAAGIGVSSMTPYRYFKDKDEIINAVRTRAFTRLADAMDAAEATLRERQCGRRGPHVLDRNARRAGARTVRYAAAAGAGAHNCDASCRGNREGAECPRSACGAGLDDEAIAARRSPRSPPPSLRAGRGRRCASRSGRVRRRSRRGVAMAPA